MNCYKHPTKEAVGTCSNCGRAVCKTCTETKGGKLLCKECLQIETTLPRMSLYNLIGAFSGWLGAMNSFIIGFYIITTYLEMALYSRRSAENLFYPAYTATILTTTSTLILVYGSYLLWKGNTRKGGIINLIAGTILSLIYTYYTILSQPPLLSWLGPIGFLLLIPAIMSGTISILIETPKN